MPENSTASLRIEVTDVRGNRLKDATVNVAPAHGDQGADRASFDEQTGAYVAPRVTAGDVVVTVEHPQLGGQQRQISLGQGAVRC